MLKTTENFNKNNYTGFLKKVLGSKKVLSDFKQIDKKSKKMGQIDSIFTGFICKTL